MTLPLIIINPASANGATGRAWPGYASDLRMHFGAFNCAFTERAGDGRDIAKHAAQAGRRLIIACGGDGTVSEIANGILESGADAELGVLPSGTGSDFRRTLGVPARFADAAHKLGNGRTRRIDVGRVSYLNPTGGERETRFFLNVASFGISSRVIEQLEERRLPARRDERSLGRPLSGRVAYAVAACQTAMSFVRPSVWIGIDDKPERRLTITNLCVANAQYFGGGMKIAPEANLRDGLLDVVAIGDLSTLTFLRNAYRVYLGIHLGLQQVHHAHARRITARSAAEHVSSVTSAEVGIEADGELIGQLPAEFEIVPQALRIRCLK